MSNKLEEGFTKADSRNLPAVFTKMVWDFMTNDERFNAPEVKLAKTDRSSRESYGNTAIGYVCLKREGDLCVVKAKICPEHNTKGKNYSVSVTVNENEEERSVIDIHCADCKAAEGGCKHAFALLSWLNRRTEEPACTETACYWKKPVLSSVGTNLKFILASDMMNYSRPVNKKLPDSDSFLNDVICHLDANQVDTQLSRYSIQLIGRKVYNLSVHQLLLLYFANESNRSADGFIEFCLKKVDPILCYEVEEQTKNQSEDLLWHEMRYGRITASKLYEIAHCQTVDGSLVNRVIGASKVFDNESMKRGRVLEQQVYDELCQQGYELDKSGFHILPSNPIFGGSPDGIGKDYILEIKCPISQATFQNYVRNGVIANKFKAQMMLQMLVTEKKKGLFCVAHWDFEKNHKTHLYWMDYDPEFMTDLLDRAIVFWKNNIYPILTKHL